MKLLISILLAVLLTSNAMAGDPKAVIDVSTAEFDLGMGYDLLTAEPKGDCVARTQAVKIGGGETVFKVNRYESLEEISKAIDISASASLKGDLGVGSAKARYITNQKVSKYSIFVLARVSVRNPAMIMRDIRLQPWAEKLFSQKGPEAFRSACGDHIIRGYISGGELLAIIKINTSSAENHANVISSIKGSMGIFSGSGAFEQKIKKITKTQETSIFVYQSGGESTTIEVTPQKLIDMVREFPTVINEQNGEIYKIITQSYNTIPLPDGMNPLDVTNQRDIISKLAKDRLVYMQELNNIDYILQNQRQFKDVNLAELNDIRNKISDILATIVDSARDCFNNYTSCRIPQYEAPFYVLPERFLNEMAACEKPLWNEKQDKVCGVKELVERQHPSCGVIYNKWEHSLCGVKSIKEGPNPICGVKLFKKSCDWVCGSSYGPAGGDEPMPECCRHPDFGVEAWKSCVYELKYKSCARKEFGIKEYKRCRREEFGVVYKTCRLPEFGLERCLD